MFIFAHGTIPLNNIKLSNITHLRYDYLRKTITRQ